MQLSYQMNMNPAIAGTIYDISPHTVDSYVSQGIIGLGYGVIMGTDPQNQVTVPSATFATGFKGIALDQAKQQQWGTGIVQYNNEDTVPVLHKGRAWVPFVAGQAIVAGTPAYLIFSGVNAGQWTNAAGAGAIAVDIPNATFITSNTSVTGGIVAIELS